MDTWALLWSFFIPKAAIGADIPTSQRLLGDDILPQRFEYLAHEIGPLAQSFC